MSEYRLTDQKYSEAEYLFQTIEMAKSDEEFDVELCSTPPSHTELELELSNDPHSRYSWTLVKRRRPRRRYTVSHGGGGGAGSATTNGCQNGVGGSVYCNGSVGNLPPAPPSTPTSSTPTNTSLLSSSSIVNGPIDEPDQRIDSLLYILDYAPKYKKKLKEQQRTDAELAELFNVVSITASNGNSSSASATSKMKEQPERGVASMSRTIRKRLGTTKIFKIHRNLKEFWETDEEDSVSAPEYDTEEEDTRFHRLGRIKPSGKLLQRKRQRRFARFEHQERMEAMVDIFDEAMTFNET
ncbi:uncharacterized protein [Musca autumnalis]|uniref:uncharacterized protein n=1 Tax=Musca autumnalis TaxID=221902 RepID=UPI003CED8EA3